MAIFEKSSQNKVIIDDTEKLSCVIENAQNINKHTEYVLKVQRGPLKNNKWTVSRRYRDFAALHASLQAANINLPLPPKKLIGNMHPSFIAERQIALQTYINEVLKHIILALSLQVRCFLEPSNYSLDTSEQALQTVSIALRGEGRFELKGPLKDIGWRINKHYFLVTDIETKADCLLTWVKYGPDRHLTDKDLQLAFKSLQSLSHPYINPIIAIHNLESGAYVVRNIHTNGTIKDMLYGTEYNREYLSKYGNPKVRRPFTMGQIAHYGHQILQALRFLHDRGLAYGHLHTGNIAIENQKVQLLDIENIFMGVPCLHRPYLVELRRTTVAEAVDVYCFGRTLYEMAFGTPLQEAHCDNFTEYICDDIQDIIRLCISSASCKHGTQIMDNLLYHPFFTRTLVNGFSAADARTHLKFPLALKEELYKMVATIEDRLRNDQKLVRKTKREVRIQEILHSEEEMRKQKRKAKKRDSVWKSTSSLADTLRSQSASTASSPTPPHNTSDTNGGTSARNGAPELLSPASDARSALLGAICNFDKSRLSRVNSR